MIRGDCQAADAGSVKTIAEILDEQGRSIGFVTTARITHASPASGYAHTADRNYEDNSEPALLDCRLFERPGCRDPASQ